MTSKSVNYFDEFISRFQSVSANLKQANEPNIEKAISCWSKHFKRSELKVAEDNLKNIYSNPVFQNFICRFFKELILSCDPFVTAISVNLIFTKFEPNGVGKYTGLQSNLGNLDTSNIETIFKESINNRNESQDQDYLAFLGFICIAMSYNPELVLSNWSPINRHSLGDSSNFQDISKQYFREIYDCVDTDFDLVYSALLTNLHYFDDFLRALVIETSKKIKFLGLISTELTDENVKSIEAGEVLGHLINDKFNNHPNNSKVEIMNNEGIKKIALIVALVVGAISTVGVATYFLDAQKRKTSTKQKALTKDPTPTPLPVSKRTPHILVLMVDGTDSVKEALDNLRNDQLNKDTVPAISKLTVLQAIWHGEEAKYENSLKKIFTSSTSEDEGNLIFIEIEMEYHEYDFDKGAGLSNARDGLIKLASNPDSHKISKIVSRQASELGLKDQISALYR